MKRPIGVVLIVGILLLWGLRLLVSAAPLGSGTGTVPAKVAAALLGFLSMATAVALWKRRTAALKAYVTWSLSYVLAGAFYLFVRWDEPALLVSAWTLLVGCVWLAVGMYLRDALRQAV